MSVSSVAFKNRCANAWERMLGRLNIYERIGAHEFGCTIVRLFHLHKSIIVVCVLHKLINWQIIQLETICFPQFVNNSCSEQTDGVRMRSNWCFIWSVVKFNGLNYRNVISRHPAKVHLPKNVYSERSMHLINNIMSLRIYILGTVCVPPRANSVDITHDTFINFSHGNWSFLAKSIQYLRFIIFREHLKNYSFLFLSHHLY